MLSLVGIIVGLALLIFLAFRGKSLLWAAPVCALLVAFTGGLDMFTAYTQNYMEGMVGFVKEWFPAFMLGAIFGQIMQDSGGAVSLTKAVVKLVGRDKKRSLPPSCAAVCWLMAGSQASSSFSPCIPLCWGCSRRLTLPGA